MMRFEKERLKIEMPKIYFHELKTRTERELDEFVERYYFYNFVVFMRYKYEWEKEWEYGWELLLVEDEDSGHIWENDWNEGQQCVEYLGIAILDQYINKAIEEGDRTLT